MAVEFIKLDFDMRGAKAALTNLQKEQFPYAYAKSLTETAEGARQAVGMQTRRQFELHTEFIPRNIKKQGASKKDIQMWGIAEASVFTGQRLDGWMGLHEWGGTKKPVQSTGRDEGRALSIPAEDLQGLSYKTKTGKVKKRYKPKELLKKYRGKEHVVRRQKNKSRRREAFIISQGGRGQAMIVRRKSKQRYPLEILYIFEREAKITPTWGFGKTVKRYANYAFRKKFNRNMAIAVQTAR